MGGRLVLFRLLGVLGGELEESDPVAQTPISVGRRDPLAGLGVRVVRKLVADTFDGPIDTSDDGLDVTPLDAAVALVHIT